MGLRHYAYLIQVTTACKAVDIITAPRILVNENNLFYITILGVVIKGLIAEGIPK